MRTDAGRDSRTRVQWDGSVGRDGEEVREEVRCDGRAGRPRVAAEAVRRARLHLRDVRAVHRGGQNAATGAVVESALQRGSEGR